MVIQLNKNYLSFKIRMILLLAQMTILKYCFSAGMFILCFTNVQIGMFTEVELKFAQMSFMWLLFRLIFPVD